MTFAGGPMVAPPVLVTGYRFSWRIKVRIGDFNVLYRHRDTGTDSLSPLKQYKQTSKLWTLTPPRKLSVSAQVCCNEYGKMMRQLIIGSSD